LSPDDFYSLDLKAAIEMSMGDLKSALKSYEDLLKDNKESGVYCNYGLTLALNKEYERAIASYEKAIEINPDASLYHLNLADSYALSGKYELAKQSYSKVLALLENPNSAQEYSNLAQAYAHLGQYQIAVKALKDANKKFPDFAELDYASSIVNTITGNYIAAIVDVDDAISRGAAPVWFSFEWFKPLCKYNDFRTSTGAVTKVLCI
jgi:serine/threonine-protein kinase